MYTVRAGISVQGGMNEIARRRNEYNGRVVEIANDEIYAMQ